VWDSLIQGFVLALIWFYKVFGSSAWSFALSIAVMTIAVRLITIPFTVPSQRAMKKNAARMQTIQPELEKLKQKYRQEPQKLQQAQLRLYQEHGINPLSGLTGCLPMFIQLPIIWAFYQSISRALATQPGEMLVLSKYLSAVPGFMSLVPLPSKFLWFDMGIPDRIVLPILVAGSTWLQQKLTMPGTQPSADPQAAQMSQSMMITMPLMFGFFAMQMPAGLSVYFIVSNVVGMGIQWLTDRWLKNDKSAQEAHPRAAPAKVVSPKVVPAKVDVKKETKKPAHRKRGYKRQK
jgi:YidC/Oxa1 family membrane protein insertase